MDEPDHTRLHPRLARFLKEISSQGEPPLYMFEPAEARRRYLAGIEKLRGRLPAGVSTEDLAIPGPAGEPLAIRIYRPTAAAGAPLPALVYFHGGGWTFGSIESHDHVTRFLALAFAGVVVSVDYRLAPEHKFPAAVEDAVAALEWVANKAPVLGIDRARIAVGGDSAGGTLAIACCLCARAKGTPRVAAQLLIYPATDMRMEAVSHRVFGDGFRLTRSLMVWCCANYMRDGRDFLDPRASPLLSDNLSGMPPAHILTAGFDPLQDEGTAFADRLLAAGVKVRHDHYPDMIHGFIGMTGVLETAHEALEHAGTCLRRALGGQPLDA